MDRRSTGCIITSDVFPMDDMIGSTVKDAATEWFIRMRDDAVSEADRAAFEIWLNADPAHADAYREMERLWTGLDQIDRRSAETEVSGIAQRKKSRRSSPQRQRSLRRMAIAASVAGLAGLGAYSLTPPGLLADHRTGAGERSRIVLEDGSTLHLNTASAVSTDFASDVRRVTLHNGEAYFEIAKDRDRPFIVDAQIGRVEVLGTAFSVKRANGAVDVIVTENQVAVSGPDQGSTVLSAGQGVRISNAGLGKIARTDPNRTLAWRGGRLVFDNRPLGNVLADLDRYRPGRIVVMDTALNAIPVTGSFAIEDTDAVLATIERTLPVRLYRMTDLLILAYPASKP